MIFIFDLDDTIYEEKSFYINGLRAISKFFSKKLNMSEKSIYSMLIIDNKKNGREKILNRFLINSKIFSKKNLILAIKIFRGNQFKLKTHNDSKKIFLNYKKINKYIVTDGNKHVQKNKIKKLGIKKYFKKTFISRNYGIKNEKPSVHCFKKILNYEKCNWNSLVYIADNPIKDFVNLNRKGSVTVRIERGNYKHIKPKKKIYDAKFKFKSFNKSFYDLLDSYALKD